MPIEIRELVIKADVSSEGGAASARGGSSTNKEEIIQEVVDKVLEVIENKNER